MRRFTWSPLEVAAVPPLPNPALRGKRIVVAGRRSDLSDQIVAALRFQGASAFHFDEAGARREDIRARLGAVDAIVDLNVDEPLRTLDSAAWEPALLRSLALLRACYEDWAQEADARRLFYLAVTQMGGTMGVGSDPVAQPLGGIWAGLAKTLPREIPNCNVRIVDLAPDSLANAAELIARELYSPGYFEIGYRNGTRWSLVARDEEAGAPRTELNASDVVLMSGGARGIGLALAGDVARRVGCRVVITGRTRVPDPDEPCVRMDDTEFRAFRHQMLKEAAVAGRLAQARSAIDRLARQRDLARQLARLREEALPVDYLECDVTALADVRAAIEFAGRSLSVVIHNAGVDAPVRLPAKSDAAFLSIVRTKVDGFLNLIRALQEQPVALKMFCNVGSLTGRWGGMVGEIDYAAANEGLSRLGLWATRHVPFPVKTLCWPTWERLGMIKNFEVAATYSSALDVAEGVSRWRHELVEARSGEVMFMGALGNLGSPVYLKGFPPAEATANISALYTQYHYAGDVLRFVPGRELRSVHRISGASAPLLYEFSGEAAPALPVSILLEYAIAAGEWIRPDGRADLRLQRISNITIDLPALEAPGTQYAFERCAMQAAGAGRGTVTVTFARPGQPHPFASVDLVYGDGPPADAPFVPASHAAASQAALSPATGLRWRGLHLKLARWRETPDGRIVGTAASCQPSDLWSTVRVPDSTVSFTGLENILRAASAYARGSSLHISRLVPRACSGGELTISGSPAQQRWTAVDARGRVVIEVEGLAFAWADRLSRTGTDGPFRDSRLRAGAAPIHERRGEHA